MELKLADGNMIAIDTIVAENEIANNTYQRAELDHLIYNAPAENADLILNGDPVKYLVFKCCDRIQNYGYWIVISMGSHVLWR